jgi:hypothetical protein
MTRIDLLTNPMTTAEDVIVGGASGVPERLAVGSEDDVLTVVSGAVAWAAPGAGGSGAPLHIPPTSGLAHGVFATVGAANNAIFRPCYIPGDCTVTGIRVNIGTSSGDICVGLYDSAGNRVATSGAVASPGTGLRTIAFTAGYAASAGAYYLAISANNNTVTFSGMPGTTSSTPGNGFSMATAHPLPTTLTTGAEIGNNSNACNLLGIVSGGWPA